MKKSSLYNIISVIIISSQFVLPLSVVEAVDTSSENLNWTTTNQDSYKVGLNNISSNGLMTSVPGCNGVTNKVQRTMSSLLSSDPSQLTDTYNDMKDVYSSVKNMFSDEVTTADQPTEANTKKIKTDTKETKFRDDCMNGIAYNLAKKQLSDITQKTTTWVATGYNGDPLFVRDQNSFFKSITNEVVKDSVSKYSDPKNEGDYPYGRSFSKGLVQSNIAQNNFDESSKSSLKNSLTPGATEKSFAKDFSQGGWGGWLSLTQKPQNNPLGFNMIASQNVSDKSSNAVQNQKDELNQNNGFLSQKKCIEEEANSLTHKCLKYETVTPGSIISSQLATTLGSPIRQLELADGVNESLSSVFDKLLNQLGQQGLSSLRKGGFSSGTNFTSGLASNKVILDAFGSSLSGSEAGQLLVVNKGSGWSEEGEQFDLTKDLGDKIGPVRLEGCNDWVWQGIKACSDKNLTKECTDGIDNDGDGKIDDDDPNCKVWSRGIIKKGIITIQKEYITAVKNSMVLLPEIVPSLGELDYCIPGPNPNWQGSTALAVDAFTSYLDAMYMDDNGNIIKPDASQFEAQFNGAHPWENLNSVSIENFSKTAFQESVAFRDKVDGFLNEIPVIGGVLSGITDFTSNTVYKVINWLTGAGDEPSPEEKRAAAVQNAKNKFIQEKNYQIEKIKWEFTGAKEYSYSGLINSRFGPGSPMLSELYVDSKTGNTYTNDKYLPMAQSGLNLTKNIVIYKLNVDTATQEYKDLIVSGQSSIYKLNIIKNKVDKIIKAAQARRSAARRAKGLPDVSNVCLNDELINYTGDKFGTGDLGFNLDAVGPGTPTGNGTEVLGNPNVGVQ